MSQTTEVEKVKSKIRALMSKTSDRGCTEAEAMSAMAKVGELLQQYDLTVSEVDIRNTSCVERVYATGNKVQPKWLSCIGGIGALTGSRVWHTKQWVNGNTEIVAKFFGMPEDTDMAIYLCQVISQAFVGEYRDFQKTEKFRNLKACGYHGKRIITSFSHGMARTISNRLYELARTRKQEALKPSTGTSLVLIKEAKVEEEFQQLGLKLITRKTTRRITVEGGYSAGQTAGGNVNLNRPVGAGRNALLA
jgi:hypothetical protein